jgi:hypothetical protein
MYGFDLIVAQVRILDPSGIQLKQNIVCNVKFTNRKRVASEKQEK